MDINWFDKKTNEILSSLINVVINSVELCDDKLIITTENMKVKLYDDGQTCCEHRYLSCDDDFLKYTNALILGFDLKDSQIEDENGIHEINFFDIKTSKGVFQIAAHNEHNGYYSGICLVAVSESIDI